MSRHLDMVDEFHRVFHLEYPGEINISDHDLNRQRLKYIEEELIELRDGLAAQDAVEVADALADLLYMVYGSAIAFGINIDPVFDEVHRSNMSKIWSNDEIANLAESSVIGRTVRVGPDATIVYKPNGKVFKPPSFEDPVLWPILYPYVPNEGRFERQG